MKSVVLLLLAICAYTVRCLPPPHPDVVAVRREEELLPSVLRKPALHNPHLRDILSLTSLLHKGETLVFEREAHGVSRREIYNILTHAGLIPRQSYPPPPSPHRKDNKASITSHTPFDQSFYEPPYLPPQDILQYL